MTLWRLDLHPEGFEVKIDKTGTFDVITTKDSHGNGQKVYFISMFAKLSKPTPK